MIVDDLKKFKIIPDPLKDQFFLTDQETINKTVDLADLVKTDVVLEVGAGTGSLTKELAKKAGRVIAFEIDERFKPLLDRLPKNVDVHFGSAWDYVQMHGKWRKKKIYNKVVSNLPYSFIEPFLHNLTFIDYDKVILLVPTKIVNSIVKGGVFSSFFSPKIFLKVSKDKFYPIPKTESVLIDLVKLPDPVLNKNIGRYLRQYMYQHEDQMVKNSLMEGLIKYQRTVYSKNLTKNEARKTISEKYLPQELLNQHPNTHKIYYLVEEKFNK